MDGIHSGHSFVSRAGWENKKMDIRIRDIRVSVPKEEAGYVETRIIDGKKCLVITADDDMTVNGVPVRID